VCESRTVLGFRIRMFVHADRMPRSCAGPSGHLYSEYTSEAKGMRGAYFAPETTLTAFLRSLHSRIALPLTAVFEP
jgi:hypothetical protein